MTRRSESLLITNSQNSHLLHAPGRVNLIGEHTDYNDGFVMPIAIQYETRVAVEAMVDRRVVVRSDAYPDSAVFDLDDPCPVPQRHWSDYVRGVAIMLEKVGCRLSGANLQIGSNIPVGAGLSSSAALEVSSALALLATSDLSLEPLKIAQLAQRAENEFVGARCGIMDQFAACHGRRGHALLLDCRSLEVQYLPVLEDTSMVVCNTMVRHNLASGAYNERRRQCEQGVAVLTKFLPNVCALRDVQPDQLQRYADKIDPVIFRRCRHVVQENNRVLDAAKCLQDGDVASFGALMTESHQSLRDDYEVSCLELDIMVELQLEAQGVYGARMTGGGFGGCTIALVDAKSVESLSHVVTERYREKTGITCEIYVCSASDAAGEVISPNA